MNNKAREWANQENGHLQKEEITQANELDNAIENFNVAMERNPEGDLTTPVKITSDAATSTYTNKSEYDEVIENFNEAMERNPEV